MENTPHYDEKLAQVLVLDELFDLTLYRKLHDIAKGDTRTMLADLIGIEQKHLAFWQDHFRLESTRSLDWKRKLKLFILVQIGRLFGETGIHLTLEAIEVYGIRKYLDLWERERGTLFEEKVRAILQDEFGHEDEIVSRYAAKNISPERVRSVFLGFNDGLVEILGAVSGFFVAFGAARSVLIAGLTVAVAGAISMGAGAYAASNSESEVRSLERGKARFLGTENGNDADEEASLSTAAIVGISYFIGSAFPILPVLFGASTALPSILFAGLAIILVSVILSFLSGMRFQKRILMNLTIIIFAVGITSLIGLLVRTYFGIAV